MSQVSQHLEPSKGFLPDASPKKCPKKFAVTAAAPQLPSDARFSGPMALLTWHHAGASHLGQGCMQAFHQWFSHCTFLRTCARQPQKAGSQQRARPRSTLCKKGGFLPDASLKEFGITTSHHTISSCPHDSQRLFTNIIVFPC